MPFRWQRSLKFHAEFVYRKGEKVWLSSLFHHSRRPQVNLPGDGLVSDSWDPSGKFISLQLVVNRSSTPVSTDNNCSTRNPSLCAAYTTPLGRPNSPCSSRRSSGIVVYQACISVIEGESWIGSRSRSYRGIAWRQYPNGSSWYDRSTQKQCRQTGAIH